MTGLCSPKPVDICKKKCIIKLMEKVFIEKEFHRGAYISARHGEKSKLFRGSLIFSAKD